jgi:hypothetical protein
VELGLGEAVEELLHRRPLGGAATGGEVKLGAEQVGVGAAVVMGRVVVAVGAIEVGERLPALHDPPEVIERQRLGVPDEQVFAVGELVATARVGPRPGQLTDLGHPHRAGGEGLPAGGQILQEPDGAEAGGGVSPGPVGCRQAPAAHAAMPVLGPHRPPLGVPHHGHDGVLHHAGQPLQLLQTLGQLAPVERVKPGDQPADQLSQLSTRTHVPSMNKGCHTQPPRSDTPSAASTSRTERHARMTPTPRPRTTHIGVASRGPSVAPVPVERLLS